MGALARTLWQNDSDKIENNSRQFYPNHLEARGLLSGT